MSMGMGHFGTKKENTMKNSRNSYNGKLNIVGDKIRFYRLKNKLSCQKLSDQLMLLGVDIHRQSIYKIEKFKRVVADYELCALAKCLKITINDLLKDYFEEM